MSHPDNRPVHLNGVRTVLCSSHGETSWRGEIICEACGRMYLLPWEDSEVPEEELLEPENPPYCDCGKLLTASDDAPEEERQDFTGRPVCSRCYEQHKPRFVSS